MVSALLEEALIYVLIATPFVFTCRFLYVKKCRIITTQNREILLGVFFIYIILLFSLTVVPDIDVYVMNGERIINIYIPEEKSLNLIPFNTIFDYIFATNNSVDGWERVSRVNLIGNILMFVPLGILAPMLWEKFNTFKKIIVLGLAISGLIEFIQYFIGRTTDVDDLILNVVGVCLGYLVYKFICKKMLERKTLKNVV